MITIVAGFGRCGSSLVMQMLEAGGMPVTGLWPGFEAREAGVTVRGGTISREWLATIPGHAIKVLDAQNGGIPQGFDYRIIWCDRDHTQQAKSQIKLASPFMPTGIDRGLVRRFEASYARDKPKALRSLRATAHNCIHVQFENLLMNPVVEARIISAHCGGLDVAKMAQAVRFRSTEARGDLVLENMLIEERK